MNFSYFDKEINKKTTKKYDSSTVFVKPAVFQKLIKELAAPYRNQRIKYVVAPEALGFLYASALAYELKAGVIVIRKGGKLPTKRSLVTRVSFRDYSKTKKTLEMNNFILKPGDRALLVDDWIETGAQMKAMIKLVTAKGAKVIGIAALVAHRNNKTASLFESYKVRVLQEYTP